LRSITRHNAAYKSALILCIFSEYMMGQIYIQEQIAAPKARINVPADLMLDADDEC
jgi:hypothetical protein